MLNGGGGGGGGGGGLIAASLHICNDAISTAGFMGVLFVDRDDE